MAPFHGDVVYHRITQVLFLVLLTGTAYGIFGDGALPGSELFAILLLAVCAYAGGLLISCIRLPPLVGMLSVGFVYRNARVIPFSADLSTECASVLRNMALALILLKAGLGLDLEKLKRLKWIVLRLSFIPCLSEAGCLTLFSYTILGLPWMWASLLGFILSAVSAAVLVPGALELEEKKIGTENGVSTLLLASVSLDNITALTGFIVIFSVLTSTGNLTWTFFRRLLEPFVGLLLGTLTGILLWYFPNREKTELATVVYYRTALLCLGGLAFTFVSKKFGVSGIGALGCVSFAFVASLRWKRDIELFKNITWITGLLWQLIEVFLFSLIGSEVTLSSLQNNIGYGTLVLFLGVSVRVVSTVIALMGSRLNLLEKVFVSASWISKATVQAAVGIQALDYGISTHKDELFLKNANQVLTMSALSILMTAPLGAALMNILGRRLQKRQQTYDELTEEDENQAILPSRDLQKSDLVY